MKSIKNQMKIQLKNLILIPWILASFSGASALAQDADCLIQESSTFQLAKPITLKPPGGILLKIAQTNKTIDGIQCEIKPYGLLGDQAQKQRTIDAKNNLTVSYSAMGVMASYAVTMGNDATGELLVTCQNQSGRELPVTPDRLSKFFKMKVIRKVCGTDANAVTANSNDRAVADSLSNSLTDVESISAGAGAN